jgi:hypothetical protein
MSPLLLGLWIVPVQPRVPTIYRFNTKRILRTALNRFATRINNPSMKANLSFLKKMRMIPRKELNNQNEHGAEKGSTFWLFNSFLGIIIIFFKKDKLAFIEWLFILVANHSLLRILLLELKHFSKVLSH